jgi:hypothetical protein
MIHDTKESKIQLVEPDISQTVSNISHASKTAFAVSGCGLAPVHIFNKKAIFFHTLSGYKHFVPQG